MENPWLVESVEAFSFLCCPECIFRSKEEIVFQCHALEHHPNSVALYGATDSEEVDIKFDPLEITEVEVKKKKKRAQVEKKKPTENKTYKCIVCTASFKHRTDYTKHLNKEHSGKVKCQECGGEHKNRKDLYRHKIRHCPNKKPKEEAMSDNEVDNLEDTNVEDTPDPDQENYKEKNDEETELKKTKPESQPKTTEGKSVSSDKENETDDKAKKPSKDMKCSICDITFDKLVQKSDHVKSVHAKNDCPKCGKVFKNFSLLRGHHYTVHTFKTCTICDKTFTTPVHARHMETLHIKQDKSNFACPKCAFTTHAKRYLIEHNTNFHKNTEKGNKGDFFATLKKYDGSKEGLSEDMVHCPKCDKVVQRTGILRHYSLMHKGLPTGMNKYFCDKCPDEFHTKTGLTLHIKNNHGPKPDPCVIPLNIDGTPCIAKMVVIKKEDEKYTCPQPQCLNMEFPSLKYYKFHWTTVHGQPPPDVPQVPETERFMCDKCPKVLTNKNTLRYHILRAHAAKNQNQYPNKLKNQQKKQIKPKHECQECKKVFSVKTNMIEHVKRVHEGSTPFKCDECTRSFGLLRSLEKHKHLVHNKVTCDVCNHVISNSFELKRHKAAVHGVFPPNAFRCDHCPLFFKCQSNLDKHIETKHPFAKDLA